MHLGIVVSGLAKYVHYVTDGVAGIIGPVDNFHHGFVATLATFEAVARDEDVAIECAAFGEQEGIVALYLEETYEGVVGALENLYHLALGHATATAAGKKTHAYAITVQGVHGIALGNVYRLFVGLGSEEYTPVTATLDSAH
jgi:hypothetical protein